MAPTLLLTHIRPSSIRQNIRPSKGQSKFMKLLFLQLFTALTFLGLVGCATKPKPSPGLRDPSSPAAVTPPVEPTARSAPPPKKTGLPADEYSVLVESQPDGATVVVNGIPVGKAPRRILLPGTSRGFFRDQNSLKVRFIGTDAAHPSRTVEELLTPLDRIPSIVRFTPSGATRVAR